MKSSPKSTPTASGPPPRTSVTIKIAAPNPMIVTEKMRTAS